jgi:DNA polymerase elongation subunit (family B)
MEKAREMGFRPLYCDTDSVMIQVEPERALELENALNQRLREFAEKEGLKSTFRLKLEKVFSHLLFTGVKKRYAGKVVYDGKWLDKPYLYVAGFEYVRRDVAPITREVQKNVFQMVLDGDREGVVKYLRGVVNDIKTGKYSLKDLALAKTLSKSPERYDKSKPDFVRGSLYAKKYFKLDIRGGDTVRMLYVKGIPGYPPTDVVCFIDEDDLPVKPIVDFEKQIDRIIRMKVEDILDLAGLSWGNVWSGTMTKRRGLWEVV